MRAIEGKLTPDLLEFVEGDPKLVANKDGFPVNRFRDLVMETARLSYLNKDHLLFYRGQTHDYRNRGNSSTFYPSIYRADYLAQRELDNRFRVLNGSCDALVKLFVDREINGFKEVKRRKFIQWSILQHYEVCSTPLLDFTHSLRVACSFALQNNILDKAYVYVFGLPYITNRITINSEHDLVNIRLLSICPPDALRPFFQEGYLAGTDDVTNEYDLKSELDFNNRLIAKFVIPNDGSFWGESFHQIPENSLYPDNDPIEQVCNEIKDQADRGLKPGDIGEFLKLWNHLEKLINKLAQIPTNRYYSFGEAQKYLFDNNIIEKDFFTLLDKLRRFRNLVVHNPDKVSGGTLISNISLIEEAILEFERLLKKNNTKKKKKK
jgi:hypothetical protein